MSIYSWTHTKEAPLHLDIALGNVPLASSSNTRLAIHPKKYADARRGISSAHHYALFAVGTLHTPARSHRLQGRPCI